MSTDLTLRDAVRDDLPRLAVLYVSSGLDEPGRASAAVLAAAWERMQRDAPTARVLVAERGGVAVGTLTCYVLPLLLHGGASTALVEGVAVHPDAQGAGVGRALMDAALTIARSHGCYKLALSSNAKRTEAHAFYERLGYERHGVSFVVTPEEHLA